MWRKYGQIAVQIAELRVIDTKKREATRCAGKLRGYEGAGGLLLRRRH